MINSKDKIPLITITGDAISGEWGKESENGVGYPVLRTTNFCNDGTINFENVVIRDIPHMKAEKKFLVCGDIIIEKSGGSDKQPVGRVVYFEAKENKYLFNNFTGVLRVKDHNIWCPKYVFYSLFYSYHKGDTVKFENKTTGLHNLQTDRFVKGQTIPWRDKAKQLKICSVLDVVSHLRSLRQQQLAKLDQLAKSRFIEMFGDPVKNPRKWNFKTLLELGHCKNGLNFHNGETGVRINCLGVGDFQNHSIIDTTDNLPFITVAEYPPKDYLLQDGDIVFVRSNGNKALVGRCLIVYPHDNPTTYSGFCIRFRQDSNDINANFLLFVLKSDAIRKKMVGRGANIQNLNQQILASLPIPVPPLHIQNEFAAFIEELDKSKVTIQKSLDRLNLLYKALLQEYFG